MEIIPDFSSFSSFSFFWCCALQWIFFFPFYLAPPWLSPSIHFLSLFEGWKIYFSFRKAKEEKVTKSLKRKKLLHKPWRRNFIYPSKVHSTFFIFTLSSPWIAFFKRHIKFIIFVAFVNYFSQLPPSSIFTHINSCNFFISHSLSSLSDKFSRRKINFHCIS